MANVSYPKLAISNKRVKEILSKDNKKSKGKKKESKSSKSSISKNKILKKPTAKLPSYSARKVVKQLADEQNRLVREVPEREIVEDKRSLFFKKEYMGEKKWLS